VLFSADLPEAAYPVQDGCCGAFFSSAGFITVFLAPLIARIVSMAVSRQREYLADAGGAELTRNPKALAHALMKIENAAEPTTSFQKGIAHLCVVDPLGRKAQFERRLVG
jgi:heat shock protein HtpX